MQLNLNTNKMQSFQKSFSYILSTRSSSLPFPPTLFYIQIFFVKMAFSGPFHSRIHPILIFKMHNLVPNSKYLFFHGSPLTWPSPNPNLILESLILLHANMEYHWRIRNLFWETLRFGMHRNWLNVSGSVSCATLGSTDCLTEGNSFKRLLLLVVTCLGSNAFTIESSCNKHQN